MIEGNQTNYANDAPTCNVTPETREWNQACLNYVTPTPSCNVSHETQEWNRLSLESVR